MSRRYNENVTSFAKIADRMLRVNLFVGGIITWTLFYVVPTVVLPIFGNKFAYAGPIIKSLAILGTLMALSITMVKLLISMDLQFQQLKIFFWAVFINIILTVILIIPLKIFGVVVASIISLIFANMIYVNILQKKVMLIKKRAIFRSFIIVFLSAYMVGAICSWLTSNCWLAASASLITYCGLVLMTGFLPLSIFKKPIIDQL
jgi:O-antigen/teichoic acid export membrane protein